MEVEGTEWLGCAGKCNVVIEDEVKREVAEVPESCAVQETTGQVEYPSESELTAHTTEIDNTYAS